MHYFRDRTDDYVCRYQPDRIVHHNDSKLITLMHFLDIEQDEMVYVSNIPL